MARLYIIVLFAFVIISQAQDYKYFPKDRSELVALVRNESVNLGDIDTSKITDMSWLFAVMSEKSCTYIKENIAQWIDLKNCIDSAGSRKDFKGIDLWDTSSVETMEGMFAWQENFNENINAWNVWRVVNMSFMFSGTVIFNQPLDKWNVANVRDIRSMFVESNSFNQNLDSWQISDNVLMRWAFSQSLMWDNDVGDGKSLPKWYKDNE